VENGLHISADQRSASSGPRIAPGVVIIDVQMRFGSMILFMVKWAIASIPALLILLVGGGTAVAAFGLLGRLLGFAVPHP
jgi:hypothetical protein